MQAKIFAQVNKTESEQKVRKALHYLFPEKEFELEDNELVSRTKNLRKLTELLEQKKIRDTVQDIAERNYFNEKTTLKFNKQAASQKDLNVYEEHPLGPIELEIDGSEEEIKKVIWGDDYS